MFVRVKGKSFVTLYTDFSFKQLMENDADLKKNALDLLSLKHFQLGRKENSFAKAIFINCSKEKSVYKVKRIFL